MNSKQLTTAKQAIGKLEKLPLRGISRAANMLCIQFGDLLETDMPYRDENGSLSKNEKGELNYKKGLVGEYSLNIQCCFRWIYDDRIILAKDDLYQPSSKILSNADFDMDNFYYDTIGNNRMDEIIDTKLTKTDGFLVSSVSVSKIGDIKIKFANGYLLDVVIDISQAEECWRFFKSETDEHLVMLGDGLEETDE